MITVDNIKKVNKSLESIDIKGKNYIEVRMICPDGAITTEIVSLDDGMVLMKSTITDESGKVLSTGYAYEKESSSFINKTSYIENCETSAVGRALGFMGIGVSAGIGSKEEVDNAKLQQDCLKPISKKEAKILESTIKSFNDKYPDHTLDTDKLCSQYKINTFEELTAKQYANILSLLQKEEEAQEKLAKEKEINPA